MILNFVSSVFRYKDPQLYRDPALMLTSHGFEFTSLHISAYY